MTYMKRVSIEKILDNTVPDRLSEKSKIFYPDLSDDTENRIIKKGLEKLRNSDDHVYTDIKAAPARRHIIRYSAAAACLIIGAAVISVFVSSLKKQPDDQVLKRSADSVSLTETNEQTAGEYHDMLIEKPGKYIDENAEYNIEFTDITSDFPEFDVYNNDLLYHQYTVKSGEFCKLDIFDMNDLSCQTPGITDEWNYDFGSPIDITSDSFGNIYILNEAQTKTEFGENHCIMKYSKDSQKVKNCYPTYPSDHGRVKSTDSIVLSYDEKKIIEYGMNGIVNIYDSDLNSLKSIDISETINLSLSELNIEDHYIENIVNDKDDNNIVLIGNWYYENNESYVFFSLLYFDSNFETVKKQISISKDIHWLEIRPLSDNTLGCIILDDNNDPVLCRIDTQTGKITELTRSEYLLSDHCSSCDYVLLYDNYYEMWNVGCDSPLFRSSEYENNFFRNIGSEYFFQDDFLYSVKSGSGGYYGKLMEYNGTESKVLAEKKEVYSGFFYDRKGNVLYLDESCQLFRDDSGEWKKIMDTKADFLDDDNKKYYTCSMFETVSARDEIIIRYYDDTEKYKFILYSSEGEKITIFEIPDSFDDGCAQIVTSENTPKGESVYFYNRTKVYRYDLWDGTVHDICIINDNINIPEKQNYNGLQCYDNGGAYDFYIDNAFEDKLYGYDIEENTLTLLLSDCYYESSVAAVSSDLLYSFYGNDSGTYTLCKYTKK